MVSFVLLVPMQFASLILRISHGINLDRFVRFVRLDRLDRFDRLDRLDRRDRFDGFDH